MSARVKRAGAKAAKALGVVFFLFLVVFNVQVATSNEHNSDINLLGLSLSIFTPSAVASEPPPEPKCSCTASVTCQPSGTEIKCEIKNCTEDCSCTGNETSVTCRCGLSSGTFFCPLS